MEPSCVQLLLLAAMFVFTVSDDPCQAQCACYGMLVDCYGRQLKEIPDDVPESVKHLHLRNNEITDLDPDKLSRLKNLEELFLAQNHIKELKSRTFANLTQMERIDLGNNYIAEIAHDAFVDLPSLRVLELMDNRISNISGLFDNIPSIERIDLSVNLLTEITDDSFSGLKNLNYLVLSDNKISKISQSAFDDTTLLYHLDLRGNPLKNVDNMFGKLGSMSTLDLSSCQLTSMPRGLPWALRYLLLSENNLTMIQAQDLMGNRYLGKLVLDKNQINKIHDGAFSNAIHLTEIQINHNDLRQLPLQLPASLTTFGADNNHIQHLFSYNFAHDSLMTRLSLGNNEITDLAANTFDRLGKLTFLNLGNNQINVLRSMTFAGLRMLNILNLESNPIKEIEMRALSGLYRLTQLRMSNINTSCALTELVFLDTPSLSTLDLQGSPYLASDIINSTDQLRSLRSVQHLSLMKCGLENLPDIVRTSLPALKTLNIFSNPWLCDTRLVGLRNWIKDSANIFINARYVTCESPENLKGRAVGALDVQDFTMPTPTMSTSTVTAAETKKVANTTWDEHITTNAYSEEHSTYPENSPHFSASTLNPGKASTAEVDWMASTSSSDQTLSPSVAEETTRGPVTDDGNAMDTTYTSSISSIVTSKLATPFPVSSTAPPSPTMSASTSPSPQSTSESSIPRSTTTSESSSLPQSPLTTSNVLFQSTTPRPTPFMTSSSSSTTTHMTSTPLTKTAPTATTSRPTPLTSTYGTSRKTSKTSVTKTTTRSKSSTSITITDSTTDSNLTANDQQPKTGESSLATLSGSTTIKMRAIIIGVSGLLIVIVIVLFIALIVVRCRRRRKRISFEDEHLPTYHTETSDTVFIIPHMTQEPNTVPEADTRSNGTVEYDSSYDNTPKTKKKLSKKSSQVNRQWSTTSSASSSFDLANSQTEDDAEFLMKNWK